MNMYKKVQYLYNTRYVDRDSQIDLGQLEANCYSFFEEESCKTICVSRDCPLLVFRILDCLVVLSMVISKNDSKPTGYFLKYLHAKKCH
jgi:hypothetical protein